MDIQTNLFDFLYDNYKITKPIRLIECFAGYGSQALSLKYLGVDFEHHKICEWATKSIQAYKDVHFENDNNDYSKDLTKDQVIEYLYQKGISMNYNQPMSLEQIKRKGEEWQRVTYNNIIATNNLVNISQVNGKDLEITDTDKYDYILTYSFPCQDLSLAGKRAGMEKDSGTRSGLLWEVERILEECKELGTLPQILLMENVPEVVGTNNIEHFKKWREKLEQLGYSNYDQILNAKDYGIPQNRRRCFMVSILGEYNYTFPQEFPLKLKLKDMLEDDVDEKYYLSQKMIKYISNNNEKWTGNNNQSLINKSIASTLNTGEGSKRCDASNYVCKELLDNFDLKSINKALVETLETNDLVEYQFIDSYNRNIRKDNICGTITTRIDASNNTFISIPAVKIIGGLFDKDGKTHQAGSVYDSGGLSPTLDTANGGYRQPCVVVKQQLRIRKLTPRECGRLMGVSDDDITKMSQKQSDASLYHLAGDSIVVDVLMAIFKQLL